ncbi:MAG: LytTR family DNA-binding domain-containing protein, partial [Lachnospiraceae bacterium]
LCDFLYVENDANYVRIHTKGGVHSTRMAFKEMEKRLSQYRYFIRCDRGIIVNLFNAKEIVNHSIVMNNGEKIPISRRNISFVNEQYSDLIFEEMEKNQHV